MTLKQFAKKITNKQLIDFWHTDKDTDLIAEAKKEGIVFAYTWDEETIMFQGAFIQRFFNYADEPSYPYELDFTRKKGVLGDEELSILLHHNDKFKYNNFQVYYNWVEDDEIEATYRIEMGNDAKYEKFKVLKGKEVYCIGVVLYNKDLV